MSNSGLNNRRVRSLPKKMTFSAAAFFERTIPCGAIQTPRSGVEREILVETPVSYSLFPAFVALRWTYPANRPRMLSTSTLAGASGMDLRLLYVQYLAA
jgi:hypothetical protein